MSHCGPAAQNKQSNILSALIFKLAKTSHVFIEFGQSCMKGMPAAPKIIQRFAGRLLEGLIQKQS